MDETRAHSRWLIQPAVGDDSRRNADADALLAWRFSAPDLSPVLTVYRHDRWCLRGRLSDRVTRSLPALANYSCWHAREDVRTDRFRFLNHLGDSSCHTWLDAPHQRSDLVDSLLRDSLGSSPPAAERRFGLSNV